MELVEKALAGNRYALARLISLIEDNGTEARAALAALYPHTGQAHVVGVTGAPGTGKSTLVNELTKVLRAQGTTVGIVAVDPSSPFSGGALLGDRVRMRDLAGDQGVFIRSMATRGSLGGLARATSDVVKVLDAAGFSVVLVETVGAGQAEVDIARTAHTTVVVEAPGLGDEVQALKAGLLEIADVLVVNKADRPGAAQTARALEMVINRNAVRGGADDNVWRPPILKTIALDGSGVPEVLEVIVAHREYLRASGSWAERERARVETELRNVLQQELLDRLLARVGEEQVQAWVERITAREVDVYTAVRAVLDAAK
ncbi:MAG: methylmalonyl Co-A mutase-associated GTPase MeaB [Chloroflexota bacterium]|nr:MAG: methylmalonyl Co-A mutase-associated GTPase MeaB [Chloroflexota bacterium]